MYLWELFFAQTKDLHSNIQLGKLFKTKIIETFHWIGGVFVFFIYKVKRPENIVKKVLKMPLKCPKKNIISYIWPKVWGGIVTKSWYPSILDTEEHFQNPSGLRNTLEN